MALDPAKSRMVTFRGELGAFAWRYRDDSVVLDVTRYMRVRTRAARVAYDQAKLEIEGDHSNLDAYVDDQTATVIVVSPDGLVEGVLGCHLTGRARSTSQGHHIDILSFRLGSDLPSLAYQSCRVAFRTIRQGRTHTWHDDVYVVSGIPRYNGGSIILVNMRRF